MGPRSARRDRQNAMLVSVCAAAPRVCASLGAARLPLAFLCCRCECVMLVQYVACVVRMYSVADPTRISSFLYRYLYG